jgi:hypothetical protein
MSNYYAERTARARAMYPRITDNRGYIAKRGYTPRVNKYPGVCECGAHVPAGNGAITRISGQWIVYCSQHKGQALY